MNVAKRIGALATSTALALGLGLTGAPQASALPAAETDDFLAQLTATYNDPTGPADDNPYDFDIVTKAVLVTGADKTLASLDTFTLFAPNDRAFEVLAKRLGLLDRNHRFGRTVDEKMVTEKIVAALGVDAITEVLLYHVFPAAKVTGADVLGGPFFQRLTMANGQKLGVVVLSRSARFPLVALLDTDRRFLNDRVVKSKIDVVETENTVVHGISDVLLPRL